MAKKRLTSTSKGIIIGNMYRDYFIQTWQIGEKHGNIG